MTVAELIELLRGMPQDAVVVLVDPDAQPGPGVSRLCAGEVRAVELGAWEANGMALWERWRADGSMDGPFSGVLLG